MSSPTVQPNSTIKFLPPYNILNPFSQSEAPFAPMEMIDSFYEAVALSIASNGQLDKDKIEAKAKELKTAVNYKPAQYRGPENLKMILEARDFLDRVVKPTAALVERTIFNFQSETQILWKGKPTQFPNFNILYKPNGSFIALHRVKETDLKDDCGVFLYQIDNGRFFAFKVSDPNGLKV